MFKTLQNIFRALYLTLTGNALKPPDLRYPTLHTWVQQTTALTEAIFAQADATGLDEQTRKTLKLRLEGRDISVETILQAVKHNLTVEYPMLMDARIEHNVTTIYALNMNDQYRIQQLAQSDLLNEYTDLRTMIQKLSETLFAIPPSNEQIS